MNARAHLTRPIAGISIKESKFDATGAQALVYRLCGSFCVLI